VQHRSDKRQKAFTLTEMAIVLAIIGLILGAVWIAAKSVFDSNKASQTAQDIIAIASNVRSTYLAANSFTAPNTGNMTATMVTAGIVPSDLIPPSGSAFPAMNAWNGEVRITLAPSGNARQFRVSFFKTPEDACIRIASQLANLGTTDAPIDFIANGGTAVLIGGGTTNSNCTGPQTFGLCSKAIDVTCAANGNGTNGTASTEFDFNIH
jgi:prepilin-type N-terminal cleavage/methylation domain-containing protein